MNEIFSNVLGNLSKIMESKGERFRAKSYKKAQETINKMPSIEDISEIKGKPGIGPTIFSKLEEYMETGTLPILDNYKKVEMFTNVYGIGPVKANELIEIHEIESIEHLRENTQLLNEKQKIGLKYYDDILLRIPRKEIDDYKKVFESYISDIATFEIVGSYRREAENSGDIDVILTNPDADDNEDDTLDYVIETLYELGYILEILSKGSTKSMLICKLGDNPARRVDFMYSNQKEFPFSILYFTGSAEFNTIMRQRALDKGYSMNEHGITNKKTGKKIQHEFNNEEDIFDFLDMEYKTPEERIIAKVSYENKTKSLLDTFKIDGIKVLDTMTKEQLEESILLANEHYYNEDAILSDNLYDILKEYIEKKYPVSSVLKDIGAPIQGVKEKVKLPFFMGSMDKIKPDTAALEKWMNKYKNEYVVSAKLDGVSGLYVCDNGNQRLYTRGNGKVGQNISHIIPYLNLPKYEDSLVAIRGEFIMKKHAFETLYSATNSNARNMVAGIINTKTTSIESLENIDFVVYEVIKPDLTPKQQFEFLSENFPHVSRNVFLYEHEVTNESLSKMLIEWRDDYEYDIDGIIVTHNKMYPRKDGNPSHSIAFKMVLSEQIAEAKVLDVLWTPSKHGYLKPRIQIEPVTISGAKIEFATAFNGAFVVDNKIGIGALIRIIRSGDVIPHIMKVIEPALVTKLPDIPYKWNDTGVDMVLIDMDDNTIVKQKNITSFFVGIGVVGLSSGNIKRIMEAGFDTIKDIIDMTIDDLITVDGFKERMATKIYKSIQEQVYTVNVVKLLASSNIFGRGLGERRIKSILMEYPNIITSLQSDREKIADISVIEGFAVKTAKSFVDKIPVAIDFLEELDMMFLYKEFIEEQANKSDEDSNDSHPLNGIRVVITGFRSKELEEKIISYGGIISSSVSKKVDYVIVRNLQEDTGKADKARKLEVPLILEENFNEKYSI